MKIILIGPTYPFRGGIAHYMTLLCQTLRQKHEVKFISFKRQYPKILFPGKSDRDPSHQPLKVDQVDYLLDPLNPWTWLRVTRTIKEYHPHLLVIPWWVSFWMPPFWFILKTLKGSSKTKTIFICHNVNEHESNWLKKIATKAVLSKADRLIAHSKEEMLRLKELLRRDFNGITAFLPTYAPLGVNRYTREEAKQKLGLTGPVLLFFGFVRPYKGLNVLLDAMPLVLKEKEVTLLIVGEFWKDKEKYLRQIDIHRMGPKIKIVDDYVPNEEVGLYFAASDLVIQPYLSATGSAISQLAYGLDRPVIGTCVGGLPEIIEDGVNGWIVPPGDPETLAKTILKSLEPEILKSLSQNASHTKEKFSWEKLGDILTGELKISEQESS